MNDEQKIPPHPLKLMSERDMAVPPGLSCIRDIEEIFRDAKAVLSEYGWLFLINDTNEFLRVQFGESIWQHKDVEGCIAVIIERLRFFREIGVPYQKFIVPEKSALYPEFLPKAFAFFQEAGYRPANLIRDLFPHNYHYMLDYLRDAKSYGNLFFRGDSHPSFLGAYLIYRNIIETIQAAGVRVSDPVPLSSLDVTLGNWEGDLLAHLTNEQRDMYAHTWGIMTAGGSGEAVLHFQTHRNLLKAVSVPPSEDLAQVSLPRRTIVYENFDKTLPKAVIFRDSTADHVHEYLAQHFSRCVFIWREGAVFENIIRNEAPDIVIQIMAERFLNRYPSFNAIIPT